MLSFIKPAPLIITAITAIGILSHEMHIDRATTVAVALPAIAASAATAGAYDKVISQNYHTHVERASLPKFNSSAFRSTLPNVQPPRDDDRRYVQNKKLLFMGGGDAVGLWPSV